MYQTFYINIDEEVNSIITRIRKSNSRYNVLVIPQGALIMQSAVSLKLIKKEVDLLEKKVMIITRDERSIIIAKKIGFPVKRTLEELGAASSNDSNRVAVNNPSRAAITPQAQPSPTNPVVASEVDDKRNRLVNLGADSFISHNEVIRKKNIEADKNRSFLARNSTSQGESSNLNNAQAQAPRDNFNEMFTNPPEQLAAVSKRGKNTSRRIVRFLTTFVILIVVLIGSLWAYFFLPKADILVFPVKKDENLSLKLTVTENVEGDNIKENLINLKIKTIEEESVLSLSFPATGDKKGSSNQKSKGAVTIYNEFSETSQVLVATTRLLSDGGKLYRLLDTVTIPGMVIKDGKTVAGQAEAEIVADESGEDFNIKEGSFTIPGLKGSNKYDKFYAKLSQETKGGGSEEGELSVVSKSDIESAKFKAENELKLKLKELVKNKIGSENLLLENALAYEILDASVFPEEGSVTENFEYQVKIRAKALVFSNKELDERIVSFSKDNLIKNDFAKEIVSFEKNLGNADIDFAKKTIKTQINVNMKLRSVIDKEKIKQSLVGRDRDDVSQIIKSSPEVGKIEVSFSPDFISNSFPRYLSRIKVEIQND
ncbi:MAG: hypothetical protein WAV16_02525 [Candidatus Moraniibacteriota bacterium]